jgi:hypothetical protein
MSKTIIDRVVEQIIDDICNYNDTTALEEFLVLLYNKKTHDYFKGYLPEEEWKDYDDYNDLSDYL